MERILFIAALTICTLVNFAGPRAWAQSPTDATAPVCPTGSSYDAAAGACVGQVVCPSGSVSDGAGRCIGTPLCAPGSIFDEERGCLAERSLEDVGPSGGGCAPDDDGTDARRVGHDEPHFQLRTGLGYAGYYLTEPGAEAPPGAKSDIYFGGLAYRLGMGFDYESIAVMVNYQHLFTDAGIGSSFNQLSAEVLARCACWSSVLQWRMGVEVGYDFSARSIVAHGVLVTQFDIAHGIFVGFDARVGGLIGGATDGPTAVGAGMTFFVGYQR